MKLGQIKDEAFTKLLQRMGRSQLPIQTAYKLKKIIDKINQENSTFESARLDLVKKYCEKDENGNPIAEKTDKGASYAKFTDENRELYTKEYNELIQIEFEIPQIPLSELSSLSLSVAELNLIEGLIKE